MGNFKVYLLGMILSVIFSLKWISGKPKSLHYLSKHDCMKNFIMTNICCIPCDEILKGDWPMTDRQTDVKIEIVI